MNGEIGKKKKLHMLPHIEFYSNVWKLLNSSKQKKQSNVNKSSNFTTQSIQKHSPLLMEMEGRKW